VLNPSPAARKLPSRDRSCITTRTLTTKDRDGIVEMFTQLSPESRYRRFLAVKRTLTPRELDGLMAIDHVNHEAIVAVDERDGSIVGVCRYVRERDRPAAAEFAIEVVDRWQRMGIGTTLAREVTRRASDNRIELLSAVTFPDNRPARALLRRLGFRIAHRGGGFDTLNWELRCRQVLSLPPAGQHAGPRAHPAAPSVGVRSARRRRDRAH
jgi:RimJ/RimL family protein N-acetyltransferase